MNMRMLTVLLLAMTTSLAFAAPSGKASAWKGTWEITYVVGTTSYTDTIYLTGGNDAALYGENEYGDPISGNKMGTQVCVAEDSNSYNSTFNLVASDTWCFDTSKKSAHNVFSYTDDTLELTSVVFRGVAFKTSSSKNDDAVASDARDRESRLIEKHKAAQNAK